MERHSQEAEKTSGLVSRMSEFSEEVETLRKQLLEKELELKEKDELLKRQAHCLSAEQGRQEGKKVSHVRPISFNIRF